MKGFELWIFLFLCACALTSAQGQDVTIVEVGRIASGDVLILDSSDFNYPTVGLDILWKFSHDIDVKVNKFKIDGQGGDFLLLSKQRFLLSTSSGTLPIDDVLENLPFDESLFMSGQQEDTQILRLLNDKGVAIYFHGYISTFTDLGLQLEITYFDRNPEETTTTTEPTPTIPPGQAKDDYVTKFVIGKVPNQFLLELEHFKGTLANMTDAYCHEKGFVRPNLTLSSDVHIPLGEIRFCSKNWPPYKECVEVTFAIVTYDFTDDYVMTGARIHEMWDLYMDMLISNGYTPYDPPKSAGRTVGWMWVAVCLGSVILVSILLCLTWLKKASDELNRDAKMSRAMTQATDEEKFYDRENPVHQIRKTMVNGRPGNGSSYDYGQIQGSWEKGMKGQEVTGGHYLPSLDGSDSSDIFRLNKLYVPDDDEEEQYSREANSKKPISEWPLQKLRARLNYAFEDDEQDNN